MSDSNTYFGRPRIAAGIFGLTGVALGAFGAHGLAEYLTANDSIQTWQTAVLYQMLHAVALLALGRQTTRWRSLVAVWSAGIVLFSGSLYFLALGGPSWLGPITPIGGLLFILGWLILCFPNNNG
jgi:uncharacterized membrane protein YgdD (TMEM256/DUF423 family)